MSDEFGVVANVCASDKVYRMGAKVWLSNDYINAAYGRGEVVGRSRGGRFIRRVVSFDRLENFRAAWVPPPLHSWVVGPRGCREDMQRFAERLNG